MNRLRNWWRARKRARLNTKISKTIANLNYGTDVTGLDFDPKRDGGSALDDPEPLVHVIPTYYTYDATGEAVGTRGTYVSPPEDAK